VLTIVESPLFQKLWALYSDEDERAVGEVYLLTLYAKSKSANISLATLKEIRLVLEAQEVDPHRTGRARGGAGHRP
jgi:hypothetical protein